MIATIDFQFGTRHDERFARCRAVETIRKGVSRWERYETVAMLVQRTPRDPWELHLGATHPGAVGPAEAADHVARTLRDHYGPVADVLS